MTGWTPSLNSHSWTSAKSGVNVFGKGTVYRHSGHAVARVSEALGIGFGLTMTLEAGGVTGIQVDADDVSPVIVHGVPETAMAVFYTGLFDTFEETGWCRFPVVALFGHDAGRVVHRAAVLEQKLVRVELVVSTTKKPDCDRLVSCCFSDGLPDVALVDVDLPGLREVEVFGPGMAVVADELYRVPSTRPVFAGVADVLAGYVPQDNCPLQYLLQAHDVLNHHPCFMDSLLPVLYLPNPHGGDALDLKAPSKCSTTLWATQLRSPSLIEARSAGSWSLRGYRPYTTAVTG